MRSLAALSAALLLGCSSQPAREVTPWARQVAGTGAQSLNSLAIGSLGEVALTGGFTGEIDLGGGQLSSAGGDDIFISMLDDKGGHLWSGRTGSVGEQSGQSVAVAANGDLLVTGNFTGKISFGNGEFEADHPAVFLARFDPSGEVRWVRRISDDIGSVFVSALAVTPEDGPVIGGSYFNRVTIGDASLTSDSRVSYVAKFDEGGSPVFTVGFGGNNNQVSAVTVDTLGSVDIAGINNGTVELGDGSFATQDQSIFLAKLDEDGTPRWVVQVGDTGFATPATITTDLVGDIVVGGDFSNLISFGHSNFAARGPRDAFVAKVSSAGQPLWLSPFGSNSGTARVRAAVADAAGHVIFTGDYTGRPNFDAGGLWFTASPEAFLAEVDAGGATVSAETFNNSSDPSMSSSGAAIGLDVEGGVVLGGTFSGALEISGATLTSQSGTEIFLARRRR